MPVQFIYLTLNLRAMLDYEIYTDGFAEPIWDIDDAVSQFPPHLY
jgi:hypothetical protein